MDVMLASKRVDEADAFCDDPVNSEGSVPLGDVLFPPRYDDQ